MSKGFIIGLGGGGYAFAQIVAEYPAGSACTCSNGTKTQTAKTTDGKWIFDVPSTGTWTVTATDGDKEKSQSVSITVKGQIENVHLIYSLFLYNLGDRCTDITGGYSNMQTRSFPEWNDDNVSIGCWDNYLVGFITHDSIDFSDYSSLNVVLRSGGVSGSDSGFKIYVQSGTQQVVSVSRGPGELSAGTITVPITEVTGGQVAVCVWGSWRDGHSEGGGSAVITQIYLS